MTPSAIPRGIICIKRIPKEHPCVMFGTTPPLWWLCGYGVLLCGTNIQVDASFCHQSWQWTTSGRNPFKASGLAGTTPLPLTCVLLSQNNDNHKNSKKDKDNDDDDDLPFLTIALPLVSLLALWPLLSLLRDTNDPTTGFDIDMFMALKGILDMTSESNLPDDILELPPLSPAERLVDAIFGPSPTP